jgi:glyoxylase-like metal-dependent hydrolase (beta-lactamase superfamily II)
MIFKQFQHEEGACLSYILGCTAKKVCAVVEPQLNIEPYLDFARAKGMQITHIFETHAQADHLSGAKRLAELEASQDSLEVRRDHVRRHRAPPSSRGRGSV